MKKKEPAPLPAHRDKLSRPLVVGQFVVYPDRNSLEFGKVAKLNPKMIGVTPISKGKFTNKYPSDVVIVEDSAMTWWLLKNSK